MEAFLLGSLVALLRSTSAVMASVAIGTDGDLGFTKNFRGSESEELGMPFGTFG